MTIDSSLEIRKLPPSHISQLSSILESAGQWKKLMAIVPSTLNKDNFNCTISFENAAKYNSDHIRLIETASQKYKRAGTEILLVEWGCSGRIRPSVGHLFHLLVKAELFRAADYVAEKILNWDKPERPSQGPAAKIPTNLDGHIIDEFLDNIDYSSSLLENVNQYSFNNNLDHEKNGPSIPHIVVTPDAGEIHTSPNFINENDVLHKVNATQEVSSMMKFSTSCSIRGSTTSTLPELFAPSVSDKSEISSGPNIPDINALKGDTGSNIPKLSSLDQQSAENIPNLSSLDQQSRGYIPNLSSLDQQSGGSITNSSSLNQHNGEYIPNLSSLDQQSGGSITNSSSLNQHSGEYIPNLSSLDQQSGGSINNSSSLNQHSGKYIPNLSSLDQQSRGSVTNSSSLNQHSGEYIPDLSSLDQQKGEYILNLSSLDQEGEEYIPNLSSLNQQSEKNITNLPSLNRQSERNIPNLSGFDQHSKENIFSNLSGLSKDSDNNAIRIVENISNSSKLNQESMNIPNIGHLLNDKIETHSSFSPDLSNFTIPNISTISESVSRMGYPESKTGKTEYGASIPNFSVLIPEMRRSSLNISNTFESLKFRHCTSPLPHLTLNTCLPHFSYMELEAATENFNEEPFKDLTQPGRFLGSGAFGKVFLASGILDKPVAVKKILLENVEVVNVDDAVTKQFRNEVEVLSRFNHENLLALLGYSCDGSTYCLIYDYISGGTLKDRLQNFDNKLMWEERLSVALGTSKAISYLHTAFRLPLIHRDIKTANILLDRFDKPKLGDFGITKLLNNQNTHTCTVVGTSAYMASEALRGDISVKYDTFSFGVVLLELLTSLPIFDENREGHDLVTHVEEKCDDSIQPLLDTSIGTWIRNDFNFGEEVFTLATQCLEEKKNRPIMVDVTKILIEILVKLKL